MIHDNVFNVNILTKLYTGIPWRIRGGGPEAVQLPEPPIDMPGPEAVPMDMPIDMDMGMPEVDITM